MVQGKHKKISYKSEKTIWLPKSQWIVVENTHEAIIEREMFETVQRMMQERTRSGEKGTIHPLAKKVVCGCCGSCMEQTGRQPRADGTQRRYVRCRMHQRAPEVCGNKTCTDMDALENVVLNVSGRMRQTILTLKKLPFQNRMTPSGSESRPGATS